VSFETAKKSFTALFEGQMGEDEARAFLVSMYERGESEDEIKAAVEVMRSFMVPFETPAEIKDSLVDNCGTGGDKSGSFNISTTVSFVLASLGLYVAKHGNRSITSKSGSADMLEALGVKIELDSRDAKLTVLMESGFAFLFAPTYHPALKNIMPIRKSLPHRTIFNMLGPLCNPAGVKHHLVGVYDYNLAVKCAKVLANTGSKRGIIVNSNDGMDEASISGGSRYAFFDGDKVSEHELDPQSYGIKLYPKEAILGGDAVENAAITIAVLKNEADEAKSSVVVLNAALALVASGKARDVQEGIEMAQYAIKSGKAYETLQKVISVSNKV
jgi:anthranilate phosphoribosyltransferase